MQRSWCATASLRNAGSPPAKSNIEGRDTATLLILLQLAPATSAVVGNDVPEHNGQSGRVDRLARLDGHCAGGGVVVASGDDPVGIRDDSAVVQEYVDVVLRREQRADVALQDEVRLAGAFDGLGYFHVGGVDEVADLAADGLLPSGQGIDVSIHGRVGGGSHGEATIATIATGAGLGQSLPP